MSSEDIVVKISNLSKCYQIYDKPNDRLKASIYPRLQKLIRRQPGQYFREFWALRDVSFEIRKGETLGIIGNNGSGKSTLLQIICGTLNPTDGKIEAKGRVAALLELGSGFNPEFTGRENVYMNAALWGLSPDEIDDRFDDIVSFADIGSFIEQPVKTYSSGMFVRLAFAVIAHVDADILVIDEALAVGDAVFAQKCMRFIRGFQQQGTLLFVSHDISAVQNLCKSGLWLKDGRIERYGKAKSICEAYIQFTNQQIYGDEVQLTALATGSAKEERRPQEAPVDGEEPHAIDYGAVASVYNNLQSSNGWKTGRADVLSVSLSSLTPGTEGVFEGGERVCMTVRARAKEALKNPILGFLVRDRLGQNLFGENTLSFTKRVPTSIEAGRMFEGIFEFRLPMLPNGQYAVMASVADGDLFNNIQHHWLHDALIITVSSSKVRYGLMGIAFERIEMGVIDDR